MSLRRGVLLDLFCIALIVIGCVLHWPMGELNLPTVGPSAPEWGTVRDALLDGPDAGEWARSMLALHDGRFGDLETHRLPAWLLIVNSVMVFEPDVILAGHLANHLLNLVLGLGVFFIGRLGGSRGLGLGGAALAMMSGHAMGVSLRFGVDIAVMALIPLTLVGALLACRHWALGLVSGLVAGIVLATHFTTLPYALPALVVILLCGGRRTRWLAALMHVLGVGIMLWGLSRVFPVSTLEEFQVAIANGISPGYQGHGRVSSWEVAQGIIAQGMSTALDRSVAQLVVQIRPSWLNWHVALLLPWLGVLGIGLKRVRPDVLRHRGVLGRLWAQSDVGLGVGLLCCLAPLPVLAAAQAPLRYGDNLSPAGALLMVRGMASVLWMVVALAERGWPLLSRVQRFVPAALGLAVFVGAVRDAEPARKALYPTIEELGYWQLGEVLRNTFPPGSGVASPVREALVQGQLRYCPRRICPEHATEEAYWHCLGVMAEECTGDAPVGYVITDAKLYDPNAVARRDMDIWVRDQWPAVQEIDLKGFTASVHAIPRDVIPALIEGEEPAAPASTTGPPTPPPVDSPTGGTHGPPDQGGSGPPEPDAVETPAAP